MKHLIFSLSRFLVVFLSSSIVFFALLVAAIHVLTLYLNHRVETVEHFSSNLLHKPVQISQFSIEWKGLMPVLKGRNVIIWNDTKTQALFKIQQLSVGINLIKSLLIGNIKLGEVMGSSIELLIYQTKDKRFELSGINTLAAQVANFGSNGVNEMLEWLLEEPSLSFQDVTLNFYPSMGGEWPKMKFDVMLKNQRNRHKLSAQLKFFGENAERLRIIADLRGKFSQPLFSDLSGRFYLEGRSISLAKWLSLITEKYLLQDSLTDFKVWADWQHDHFTQIHTVFSNQKNSVLKITTQAPITIMPFFASVRWNSSVHGYWSVNAIVKDLNFSAWREIPGIKGLNAYCYMTAKSGYIISRSKNVSLYFSKLFRAPIHLNNLFSELHWRITKNGMAMQIPKLEANNADLSINTQLALLMPINKKKSKISLLAHIKTNKPSRITYYLPQPFIGSKLMHWLNSAIINGSGDTTLLWRGPIFKFPFDKDEGTFLVNTRVKDGELHYESGWPNLEKINANLIFSGRKMQIFVDSARIFSTHLENIQADIPIIKRHIQAVLHIVTKEIHSSLENGLAFLHATPLIKTIDNQLSGLLLHGPLRLALQFTIPLESGTENLKIIGLGATEDAIVRIPSHHIQINHLKGQFFLSQTGVQAENLFGMLWDKPIVIGIRSKPSMQLTINYSDIQTVLNSEESAWRFSVDNKFAQGSVLIPKDQQKAIDANFSFIVFNSAILAQNNTWHFNQIPKINFHANNIRYDGMDIGMLQLALRSMLNGVAIQDLQAGNANYHIIARGAWHDQSNPSTEIFGQLDSSNLSGFLHSWGLPASITAEQAHIRFNLQWLGMPSEIEATRLQGNFSFSASNGQIVDIGSNAEAKLSFGRLLTFLSLQSLSRRLQLDFSDLQTKGFNFTALQGHFTLKNGNAFTKDTSIEGPVAVVTITGRIGLFPKNYDLVIKIRPHFTSSLPVIVGLAGGPVAGVVTWIANAVLGSTVQKIAETTYHVTGSWGKPEITKTST